MGGCLSCCGGSSDKQIYESATRCGCTRALWDACRVPMPVPLTSPTCAVVEAGIGQAPTQRPTVRRGRLQRTR